MRLVAPPNVNTEALEAYRASSARFLVTLLSRIGGVFEHFAPLLGRIPLLREAAADGKASAARSLRQCVRSLRHIVADLAFARMRLSPYRRIETRRPGGTRGHARRSRRRIRFNKSCTASLFRDIHRGTLRQRAERLARLFANLEPLIARTLKRLSAMWRHWRTARRALVVKHDVCAGIELAAPAFTNTS
jgi:hypothetical protein